jgi:hypothetical protein
MAETFVAKAPPRARVRLNLAPRLREDETLSSWLERFGGAYGLTLGEFMRWMGYRAPFSYGQALIDLDAHPPRDLSGILEQHTGVSARVFDQRRLVGCAVLPLRLRRAFCARCWAEDGPYRRREWASAWSLVCTRHQRFLREKPPLEFPVPRNAEESWLAYYDTPRLWRDSLSAWEDPSWVRICDALGVSPRTEFLHAYSWLRDLQRLGRTFGHKERHEDGASACEAQGRVALDGRSRNGEWTVRRDLVIYGLLRFHEPSLLETLDSGVEASRLIQSGHRPDICGIVTPEADYYVRILATATARHLWEKMTRGQWRCREPQRLEAVLGNAGRWNDEDWWLERHLYYWPEVLRQAGRQLFRKETGWTQIPPWTPCREYCTRHLTWGHRGVLVPIDGWRCQWLAADENHGVVAGREGRRRQEGASPAMS